MREIIWLRHSCVLTRIDSIHVPPRVAMHEWWLRLTTNEPRLHVGVGRIRTRNVRDLITFFYRSSKGMSS